MHLADLAETLCLSDKNVLVLDTCTLLDVIRSPLRDTLAIADFAVRMSAEIQNGTLPFSIVLPSLFSREWSDNVASVRDELSKSLSHHRTQSNGLVQLHRLLFENSLFIPDVTTYLFVENLERICAKIMGEAKIMEAHDQCTVKAMSRVIDCRSPSQRGKQSAKDCQIFEEMLELGRLLRAGGFIRKIVFASSNKADYGDTSNPHPDIKADLDAIGGEFTSLLNYAYHIAAS